MLYKQKDRLENNSKTAKNVLIFEPEKAQHGDYYGVMDMENSILYIILGTGLIICTITDLKYKEIYLPVVIAEILLLAGFHIWQGSISLTDIVGTVIIFALFMVSCVVSRGQIGFGDAFLFVVTGFGLGFMVNIFIIMFSFILAFCAAVFLVVVKHKPRSYCMPFAPFVLSSFIFYVAGIYLPL